MHEFEISKPKNYISVRKCYPWVLPTPAGTIHKTTMFSKLQLLLHVYYNLPYVQCLYTAFCILLRLREPTTPSWGSDYPIVQVCASLAKPWARNTVNTTYYNGNAKDHTSFHYLQRTVLYYLVFKSDTIWKAYEILLARSQTVVSMFPPCPFVILGFPLPSKHSWHQHASFTQGKWLVQ